MGYKKGESLGVSGGLVEPIQPVIKTGKHGIGAGDGDDALLQRKRSQEDAEMLEHRHEKQQMEHRARMNRLFDERRAASDLTKSRVTCQTLDERIGVNRHDYWPPEPATAETLSELEQDKPVELAEHVVDRDEDKDEERVGTFEDLGIFEQLQLCI
eukprot:jgi/Hompol1/574/HPOL_002557-RA